MRPLRSTALEFARTRQRHERHIDRADRLLRDYESADGAIAVVVIRKSA